jgi:alpha-D-ribose 1-methylphosphonate 5-triphosphate synthase subunit PhnH
MSLTPSSATPSSLGPGLADPSHDSQRLFRAILDAFAHPGSIVGLPQTPEAAEPLSRAATAFLLTLVDRETPLWLASDVDSPALRDFVRFHTGSPIAARPADALFAVTKAATTPPLDGFAAGVDPYPDRSATVIIDVPALGGGPVRAWRGPGIDNQAKVAVAGLSDAFWSEWAANRTLFPCGVDVVFTAGTDLVALPRSISVET